MIPRPSERIEATHPAILALVAFSAALALYLPELGAGAFVGDDEALDAGVVQEIFERGEWLFPEFNGEYLPPKPPLYYWAAAAVARARGSFDEWSVRLPAALAGAATAALVVAAGAQLVGRGPALLAGLFLIVMPITRDQARLGRPDMMMSFLAAACLFLFQVAPEPLSRARRWLFYVLLGLTMLAKGAAGAGLVAIVIAATVALGDRRRALRSLVDPSFAAFLVVGAGWYAAASWHWGWWFVERHVVGENFRHFFGGLVSGEPAARGLAHHLTHFLNIFTGTLPWGFLLPAALADLARTPAPDRTAGRRFLVVWLLAGFAFFTIATRKSPYYLLPIFPPVALLAGAWAWPRVAAVIDEGARPRISWPWLASSLGVSLIVMLLAWALGGAETRPIELDAIGGAAWRHPLAFLMLASGFLLLAATSVVAIASRSPGPAIARLWGTAFLFFSLLNLIDGPLAEELSLLRFAREVARVAPAPAGLYFFELPLPAVALYVGRRIPTLQPGGEPPERGFFLVVPESLRGELPQDWRAAARSVVSMRARVFTRRRMGIELLQIGGEVEGGEPGTGSPPPTEGPGGSQAALRYSDGPCC